MPTPREDAAEDVTEPVSTEPDEPKRPEPELADIPPPMAPSRRKGAAALEEVTKFREEFTSYRTAQEKRDEEYRQRWEQERQELRQEARAAREAAERASTRQAPRDDNSDADYAQAIKDLKARQWAAASKNDTDGWDEAGAAIRELELERNRRMVLDEVDKRLAASRPVELPEEVQELEREFSEIKSVKGWRQTVAAWDAALAARGEAEGPARYRKAFEQASIALGKREPPKPARPSAEQRSRSLATGASAGGNGGGGRPQIVMPPNWRDVAKRNQMSEEEYTRYWMQDHPELIGD